MYTFFPLLLHGMCCASGVLALYIELLRVYLSFLGLESLQFFEFFKLFQLLLILAKFFLFEEFPIFIRFVHFFLVGDGVSTYFVSSSLDITIGSLNPRITLQIELIHCNFDIHFKVFLQVFRVKNVGYRLAGGWLLSQSACPQEGLLL